MVLTVNPAQDRPQQLSDYLGLCNKPPQTQWHKMVAAICYFYRVSQCWGLTDLGVSYKVVVRAWGWTGRKSPPTFGSWAGTAGTPVVSLCPCDLPSWSLQHGSFKVARLLTW